MPAGFTKHTFRTPQLTGRLWSRLLALRWTFQDSTNDSTTIESTAGFIKDMSGHHKWQHENGWLTFVCQNLKISGQVFKRPKRLHHKIFLAKADLPGSFCRQLWWTLWNGQWDKVSLGNTLLPGSFCKVAYPTNLRHFGKRSLTKQLR